MKLAAFAMTLRLRVGGLLDLAEQWQGMLMSLASFGMVLLMSRAGFETENLDDYKGLNKKNPWFAAMMLMVMFSMAGVPFFIGFFAKFSVLQAVVAANYIWLAVFAVLSMWVLISANGLAIAGLGIMPQALMSLCAFALLRSL